MPSSSTDIQGDLGGWEGVCVNDLTVSCLVALTVGNVAGTSLRFVEFFADF